MKHGDGRGGLGAMWRLVAAAGAVLGLGLFLIGCAADAGPREADGAEVAPAASALPPTPAPPTHYRVVLSPRFDRFLGQLTDAIDSWTAAVPELSVEVTIGDCVRSTSEVCVLDDSPNAEAIAISPEIYGWTDVAPGGVLVHLYLGQMIQFSDISVARLVQITMAHELGHAMGLHHTGNGTLMAPALCPDNPTGPTSADVAQFRQLRGGATALGHGADAVSPR